MTRKIFCLALCAMLYTLCGSAQAQQTTKVPRIAFLGGSSASAYVSFVEAFQQGLRSVGYSEGKNLVIEYRYAEGKLERLAELTAELVRIGVDVIVVSGARAIGEAKKATKTIPIVMTTIEDPVAMGIVASLARPGENITGLTNLAPELSGKRLDLLKEAFPKISRVAVLWPPGAAGAVVTFKETEVAARTLGIQLQSLEVRSPEDFEGAFRAATTGRARALLVLQSALTNAHRKLITDLAVKNRLPAMYTQKEYVESGGLMSYGVDARDLYRRAAVYVDKILKGAKPADLPVEQPTKFEFVINLKTAKQIGLTIPPNVLARADKVIK
jgi:putative ABC transport system substrate-binding protein